MASVIILALVNITTLGIMWTHKPHKKCKKHMTCHTHKENNCDVKECKKEHCSKDSSNNERRGRYKRMMSGDIIAKRLNFSTEQVAELKKIQQIHFEEIKQLRSKKQQLKWELMSLVKGEPNTELASGLINKNAELGKQILLNKMNHFSDLKKLCSTEQLDDFYKLIDDMESQMRQKHKK